MPENAGSGSMRPMRLRKAIEDYEVFAGAELLCKLVLIAHLLRIKAHILEHQHLPAFHLFYFLFHHGADAIGYIFNRLMEKLRKFLGMGNSAKTFHHFAVRTLHISKNHDFAIFLYKIF